MPLELKLFIWKTNANILNWYLIRLSLTFEPEIGNHPQDANQIEPVVTIVIRPITRRWGWACRHITFSQFVGISGEFRFVETIIAR